MNTSTRAGSPMPRLAKMQQHRSEASVHLLTAVALAVSLANARSDLRFVEPRLNAGQAELGVRLPDEPRQIVLEQAHSLTSTNWQAVAVHRPAAGQTQTVFAVGLQTN